MKPVFVRLRCKNINFLSWKWWWYWHWWWSAVHCIKCSGDQCSALKCSAGQCSAVCCSIVQCRYFWYQCYYPYMSRYSVSPVCDFSSSSPSSLSSILFESHCPLTLPIFLNFLSLSASMGTLLCPPWLSGQAQLSTGFPSHLSHLWSHLTSHKQIRQQKGKTS